jgi:hypothetical protein
MKKLLVVFAKRNDFNNLTFNKSISKTSCQNSAPLFVGNEIHYEVIQEENEYILITVKFEDTKFSEETKKNIDDTLGEAIKSFIKCIADVLNMQCEEFIVIVHEMYLYPNDKLNITSYSMGGEGAPKERGDILKEIFEGKIIGLKEGYAKIKKNFVTEEDKKRNILFNFSLLKHRIMTSFLDLDIDWQGIKEVNEKDKKNAKKYLNAILEKKSKNYYCQKLVNLWFYLTGKNDIKIDDKVTTSLNKKDLPYEKSVLDLINELDELKKYNLKEKWINLLRHVGLNVDKDKNEPYKIENINLDEKSIVILYLKNIDLLSQQNKENRNVNIFLGKLEKTEDEKKEIIYFNFHEWYLKLGDLLEELKSFLE